MPPSRGTHAGTAAEVSRERTMNDLIDRRELTIEGRERTCNTSSNTTPAVRIGEESCRYHTGFKYPQQALDGGKTPGGTPHHLDQFHRMR